MINNVTLNTKFNEWKNITNQIIVAIGDITTLDTTDKTNLTLAINEVLSNLGDIATLTTTDKTSVVLAINEIITKIGDMSTLKTTNKTVLVAALNEIFDNIGPLSTLTTTEKGSAVGAINEIDAEQGDLTALTTTEKGSVVGAINEVDANADSVTADLGDITTLTTTNKASAVAAINEVDTLLDTKVDTNTLLAYQVAVAETNKEPNLGRFSATEDESAKAVITFATTGSVVQAFNSSIIAEGAKFIDDNADNGGAGGTLGVDMSQLLTAMASTGTRTNLRYGFEFFIADITGGAGVTNPITVSTIDYNPMIGNGSKFLTQINKKATWVGWVRLKTLNNAGDNGIILGDANTTVYIDGVDAGVTPLLATTDGWKHVRMVKTMDSEYDANFPYIAGNNADVLQIACSALFNGEIDVGIHVGVI